MLFEEQKNNQKKRKENINLKVLKTRNGRTMLSSNVMYVKAKKKRIILDAILSTLQCFNSRYQYKMNEIVNRFF